MTVVPILMGGVALPHAYSSDFFVSTSLIPSLADGCAGGHYDYRGGTLVYAAPELLLAARSSPVRNAPPCYALYGPAVDCWALGLVAFKLLTGYNLFRSVDDAVPSETDERMDNDEMACQTQCMADFHAEWVRAILSASSLQSPWIFSHRPSRNVYKSICTRRQLFRQFQNCAWACGE
jgi:hypothetical protein